MRAVVVDPTASSLTFTDVADPSPQPGELLVEVRAAGLNRADLAVRRGGYVVGTSRSASAPTRPFIAGGELSGTVVAVGDGVRDWRVGDEVMAQGRGYAELATVDARLALAKPPPLSWEEAGALPIALLTMHDALITNGRFTAGQSVVIHAVTSGVGVVGAQLALHLGAALVLGTSRSPAKWPALHAVLGDDPRFTPVRPEGLADAARSLTDDRGIDVIIDNVGAAVLAASLESAAIKGRIVQVGRLGGRHGELDLDELARRRVSLVGVTFRTRTMQERVAVRDAVQRDLAEALAAGVLRPPVHATFPLAEAEAAQEALARDEHIGKLVLVP
jgi:NADPH2:quinone reductase